MSILADLQSRKIDPEILDKLPRVESDRLPQARDIDPKILDKISSPNCHRLPGIDLETIRPDLPRGAENHLFGRKAAAHASIDKNHKEKLAELDKLNNTPEDNQKLVALLTTELENAVKYIDKTKLKEYELSAGKAVIKNKSIGLDTQTQNELLYLIDHQAAVKEELVCRINGSINYLKEKDLSQAMSPKEFAELKEYARAFAIVNNYQEKYSDMAFHKRPLDLEAIGISVDLLIAYAPGTVLEAQTPQKVKELGASQPLIDLTPETYEKLNPQLQKALDAGFILPAELLEYKRNGEIVLKPLTPEVMEQNPNLSQKLAVIIESQQKGPTTDSSTEGKTTINERLKQAVLDINNKAGMSVYASALAGAMFGS